jgi:hypothetical protein
MEKQDPKENKIHYINKFLIQFHIFLLGTNPFKEGTDILVKDITSYLK